MAELSENKVLIAGGVEGRPLTLTSSTLILDLKEETFSEAEDLHKLRSKHSCALFNNRVYLAAKGEKHGETDIFEDGTWIPGPSFPKQINDHGGLVAAQNHLFYSDSENFYMLKNGIWEPIFEAQKLKLKGNYLPLTVLTMQSKSNSEKLCMFP